MRPRSPPCLPSCVEVDQMMSSTVAVSSLLRSLIAFKTVAASCCGCRCESAPLPGLPMPRGVRTASMIYASDMRFPLCCKLSLEFEWRGAQSRPLGELIGFPASRVGRPSDAFSLRRIMEPVSGLLLALIK